ncbi:type II toxin-antitoxin system VapC family toxin [Wenzhouxiangella sp. XN24]|uniref:type II toxin-antitoxin system VapC family toxin n=1 Tax=Wenzhouxiangella sp. XN24 TaxID=2713569 RepID=UPI0013EC147D|nr:type II toxin-antitoxin system VapC family toxin [Wenzhouxiangella sp. XN24]NGX15998.1 type II toxin-antitoxin system VapC family toxin [Wenzhouxiangella sp. XN24]
MIVLDTHVLLWWLNGDSSLSSRARNAIRREQTGEHGSILVSAISAWEIAMLVQKERLALTMDVADWLDVAAATEGLRFVPLDSDLLLQSTRLPGAFHSDPADRMIVALARHLNVALVTSDQQIRSYKHVRTIW